MAKTDTLREAEKKVEVARDMLRDAMQALSYEAGYALMGLAHEAMEAIGREVDLKWEGPDDDRRRIIYGIIYETLCRGRELPG